MNEKSKVLALKYRPKVFEEIIGQKITADTIINSIKADKIPNAYLFTGIRGVGKTTIARIVAKSLNCLNGIEKICEKNKRVELAIASHRQRLLRKKAATKIERGQKKGLLVVGGAAASMVGEDGLCGLWPGVVSFRVWLRSWLVG